VRIFIAGASGVIGIRLVPLLAAEGHEVVGMTRSQEKADRLRALGAEPVVCDVFDANALRDAVTASTPELVMDELTDLPDDVSQLRQFSGRNDRMRSEGTRNLLAAAKAAQAPRFLAQSIAWRPPGRGQVVDEHERMVLEAGGVVLRYGQLYGPGTFYEDSLPPPPRTQIDEAVRATVPLLEAPSGVYVEAEAGPSSD
jgi:nucleoside-diphosphate-sugar epimerase